MNIMKHGFKSFFPVKTIIYVVLLEPLVELVIAA